MGRPPAYIFVVRHGHRLDAADKQWHLTSPTPYDPPLTYGGWMHSRTVGARIAAILRDEAAADVPSEPSQTSLTTPSSTPHEPSRKRRRFRVVIHSSPFLRCVQTSVAIGAGLASNPAPTPTPASPSSAGSIPSQSETVRLAQAPSSSNPPPTKTQPGLAIHASANPDVHDPSGSSSRHVQKSVLRLDPFLGEWQTPEYFEHITPPPKSALMLATAKAELLRRSSYNDYPHFHARIHSVASSHLWNNTLNRSGDSGTSSIHDPHAPTGLDTLSHLSDTLPGHEDKSGRHLDPRVARGAHQENRRPPGYVFPVPSYALSTSEPIPKGYVAHARDACVSIDYQWDSSRDNLAWGDGGTLPEEWASMHQRFRRGLRQLVDWYVSTEGAGELVTRTVNVSRPSGQDIAAEDSDEIDDVVVLVSHGAGCNALIGALTQQPVLADVAMSSLSMAKRRPAFDSQYTHLVREGSFRSPDTALPTSNSNMAEMYELKLFANTDHLAKPSPPSTANRGASSAKPNSRARFNSDFTSALKEINFGSLYGQPSRDSQDRLSDTTSSSRQRPPGQTPLIIEPSIYNASTGGITVGSGMSSFSVTRPDRSGSGTWGLWSPKQNNDGHNKEPESPMFLDFSHEKDTKYKEPNVTIEVYREPEPRVGVDEPVPTIILEGKGMPQARGQGYTSDQHDEEHDEFDETTVPKLRPGTGSGGLWGAPVPPGEAERLRDFSASKRRWTVTER